MTEHKLPEENSNDVSGSVTPDISSDLSNTKTSQQQVIREAQRLRSKLHIPPPPESVSPSCIKKKSFFHLRNMEMENTKCQICVC